MLQAGGEGVEGGKRCQGEASQAAPQARSIRPPGGMNECAPLTRLAPRTLTLPHAARRAGVCAGSGANDGSG